MDARIDEIRTSLAQNYDKTKELLSSLSAADMAKTAANGWTVAQLAGHVAAAPGGAVWLTSRLRNNRSATVPGFLSFLPALRNWMQTRKHKQATSDELLSAAKGAHEEILSCVAGLKDEELDNGGVIFGQGRRTVYDFLSRGVADHAEEHRAEIRAAIGGA